MGSRLIYCDMAYCIHIRLSLGIDVAILHGEGYVSHIVCHFSNAYGVIS